MTEPSTPEIAEGERQPYDHRAIEARWRDRWEAEALYRTDLARAERPYYNLAMFPYPSAEGLHVGHLVPYSNVDIHGRYRRMKGDDVFEPMGFDAFGIHSENYALKIGEHPAVVMKRAVQNFRENQMKRLGTMFDWSREVNTSSPEYYRWTQWLFIRLFRAGLAERREGPVNWCPSCLTVLADEQVEDGRCERCKSDVQQRVLTQWWLSITRYAQAMLDAIEDLDWSESTKEMQRNWIGRSEGAEIRFGIEGCAASAVPVFTTRPDTVFGATFLVIGATHPRLIDHVSPARRAAVLEWTETLPPAGSDADFSVGIDLGTFAVHPLTEEHLPVYAAPYVLGDYGTGAIMAVPAHDARDHEFARQHGLPIVQVVAPAGIDPGADIQTQAYLGPGVVVNSGDITGMPWDVAKTAVIGRLRSRGSGDGRVQFKLRDWLVSRQRYWGAPIPIIHCPEHGPVPVPEDQLPVLLPDMEDFRPLGTGRSPLASAEGWVDVECPECGAPARRETDVLDTFVDSSWYFLRYPSTEFDDRPFDDERTRRWLPVDMYVGGNEHAVRHLLYSRFIMRALHDMGLAPSPEPFRRFRAHGMIVKDGHKMSKSRGNVVNPDEYIDRYGADAMRLYITFLGPYESGGDFRDEQISGVVRFLERVWRCTQAALIDDAGDTARERRRHRLVARVDELMPELGFNRVIALLMEFARELDAESRDGTARRADAETLLQLLAPLAPHITEELWERGGHTGSVHATAWPTHDPALAALEQVTVGVQVDGKLRDRVSVPAGMPMAELEARALALPRIVELLAGRPPRKVIVVPDRIVNIVAS